MLGIDQDAVSIEQMEKEIAERAFAEGWVKPRPSASRTGRRVAVVGSGPVGLAAAQLNQARHTVTVYERDDRLGGLLRYGIPDFKPEKSVLDRRLALLEAEGVEFRTGVDVGREPGFRALREQHDALLLAMGARRPRELHAHLRIWAAMPVASMSPAILEAISPSSPQSEGDIVVGVGLGLIRRSLGWLHILHQHCDPALVVLCPLLPRLG